MAVYADVEPLSYSRSGRPSWRAVGWLGKGSQFPQGEVSPIFFDRLCTLLLNPWQPVGTLGFHSCELCPAEIHPDLRWEDPSHREQLREIFRRNFAARNTMRVGEAMLEMGCKNLWVPGHGCVYVAPSLIAHYIRSHCYKPPDEFIDAVLRCPDTRPEEFQRALLASGG